MESGGGNLYVIDDEPFVLELIEQALFGEPFEVRSFSNAQDALNALEHAEETGEEVSMVLLDMFLGASSMPAEDLFDMLARKEPSYDIVIMSGRLSTNECYEYILKGAADYIHKPFSISAFKELVRNHIDIGHSRHSYISSPWSAIRRTNRDVFLGYCSDDRGLALGWKRLLEKSGLSVWYGDLDGKAAGKWQSGILTEALDGCRAALFLLTPNALNSQSLKSEMARAIRRKEVERDNYLAVAVTAGIDIKLLPESWRSIRLWDVTDHSRLVDNLLSLSALIQAFIHPSAHLEEYRGLDD